MSETRLKPIQEPSTSFFAQEQTSLEVNGYVLQPGDWLELYVFGHWIPGRVDVDAGGWYCLTRGHTGLRLRPGLRARLISNPRAHTRPSETLVCV